MPLGRNFPLMEKVMSLKKLLKDFTIKVIQVPQPTGSQAPAAPDRNELPEEPESSPVKTPPRASDEP